MLKGATRTRVHVTAALAALWLTACGGGGGGDAAPNPPAGQGPGVEAPAPAPAPQQLSWTQTTSAAQPHHTVAMNAAGTVMVAGGNIGELYVSRDSGSTWELQTQGLPGGQRWVSADVDGSGNTILAAGFDGQLYRWTPALGWIQVDEAYNAGQLAYESVAVSSDGLRMLTAVQNGPLRYSVDGGTTWLQAGGVPAAAMWRAVDLSADGMTAIAAHHDGTLYLSTDGGANFAPLEVNVGAGPVNDGWYRAAISGDGSTIVIAGNQQWGGATSGIYVGRRNADGTWTWTQGSTVAGNYGAVSVSANGQVIAAGLYAPTDPTGAPGQILVSTNGGASFSAITPPSATEANYRALALNGAGDRLLVGAGDFAGNGFTGTPGALYLSSGSLGQ